MRKKTGWKTGMIRVRKEMTALLAATLCTALVTGCGSSNSASQSYAASEMATADYAAGAVYDYGYDDYEYDYDMEEAYDAPAEAKAVAVDENGIKEVDTSRKLIRTVNLSVETKDIDELDVNIAKRVAELGGYIESSSMDGRRDVIDTDNDGYDDITGQYIGSRRRTANYTIRIPAEKLDQFVESVTGATNVTSQSMNVQDITSSYVDIDSRRKVLQQEEQRLLEMLELAYTVEEMLEIEEHLSDVRYQLESIQSQLRSYDNRVAYSTVNLDVRQVWEYTPVVQDPWYVRMGKGFVQSLTDLLEGIGNFLIWIIVHLPYLIFWGALIALAVWLIRRYNEKHPERAAKRAEKKAKRAAAKQAQLEAKRAAAAAKKAEKDAKQTK